MPIDLVIDEREGGSSTPGSSAGGEKSGLPGDGNGNGGLAGLGGPGGNCKADSSSHTDGASTPDAVGRDHIMCSTL